MAIVLDVKTNGFPPIGKLVLARFTNNEVGLIKMAVDTGVWYSELGVLDNTGRTMYQWQPFDWDRNTQR